ncbi:MAG TPA: hypothetical protein VFV38_25535 [Ktedonobacteraceae bacterium]|nr:hypothetical protein [Ktedonobacteraceae bacterium]
MKPIAFWQNQGTLFGLQSRPALTGDDEQHFLSGVDGTEQAFRSLCAVENNAPYCPQTQKDFARFFRAFHRAACQAHFP